MPEQPTYDNHVSEGQQYADFPNFIPISDAAGNSGHHKQIGYHWENSRQRNRYFHTPAPPLYAWDTEAVCTWFCVWKSTQFSLYTEMAAKRKILNSWERGEKYSENHKRIIHHHPRDYPTVAYGSTVYAVHYAPAERGDNLEVPDFHKDGAWSLPWLCWVVANSFFTWHQLGEGRMVQNMIAKLKGAVYTWWNRQRGWMDPGTGRGEVATWWRWMKKRKVCLTKYACK